MITISEESVKKDIKKAKTNGYFDRLKEFYKRVPTTKCNGCGICCQDSPEVTYTEFIYVYDYMQSNFNESVNKEILRKAIKTHMYGLLEPGRKCPFLNEDHKCIIYERAPISCKFWGLYELDEYNNNLAADEEYNVGFRNFYKSIGITIPKEVNDFKIPYCNNVKVLTPNFEFEKLRDYGLEKLFSIEAKFMGKQIPGSALGEYLAYMIMGYKGYEDRITVTKQYQAGDEAVIDRYVNNVIIEKKL